MKSSHIAATGLAAALVAFSGSLVSSGGSRRRPAKGDRVRVGW